MTVVTATALTRAIHEALPDAPVLVEQTGGGTATIYVGDFGPDDRAAFAIGPGRYDWRDSSLSTFWLNSDCTCVGPDDDGEAPALYFTTLTQVTDYLRPASPCSGCERLVDGDEVPGLRVEEGGDIPTAVWCLDCVTLMDDEQRALTHDDAVTAVLHECEPDDPNEDGFVGCLWCGLQMLHVGSAGYQSVAVLVLPGTQAWIESERELRTQRFNGG